MRRFQTEFLFLLLVSVLQAQSRATSAAEQAPQNLLCESMVEPLGLGITLPRLSWQMRDDRRGALQTAYQIRVATSLDLLQGKTPDVWDSGRRESSESVNVVYGGPRVVSRRRYFWEVRVWDREGHVSAYSKPSWWEMGLLASTDWEAEWITPNPGIDRGEYDSDANWIWGSEEDALRHAQPGKRFFRFHFSIPQQPEKATLLITAKDHVGVWLNGKSLLDPEKSSELGLPRDTWSYSRQISLTGSISQGANILAVEASVDASTEPDEPTPAGMIALLRAQMPDGTVKAFTSGPSWITSREQTTIWFSRDFDDSAWQPAISIQRLGEQPLGNPFPKEPAKLLRRSFDIEKSITSARIYSTALGSYQLYLNGQRVGNDVLAPGWTDYSKRIPYQVYDVTSQLHRGANAIGAILGGGWYADGLSWEQTRYSFGPPPVRVLVQLEIEYEDGTRDRILSDKSWNAAPSPILFSEIYNGESYDGTLKNVNDWSQPSFPDRYWGAVVVEPAPAAPLVAQDFLPIRITQTLPAKAITNPKPGTYIFDLGQNMVGWERLHVTGPKGTKIRLRFGEVLQPNGELYTANLRTAEATDTYVLSGTGSETFEPHFTFHGFRYIELTGFPGVPSLGAAEGIVFHTDAPLAMKFATEDPTVNQLWSNILWGQRSNFLSVPTDCPQRDERMGWMGDAQVFWRTAAFNAELGAFSHKFASDMRDAQSSAGAFSDVSPRVGPTSDSAPGWGDAGVIIPWTAYTQYRDTRILEENWDAMEKWMRHIQGSNPDYLWLNERGNDYGDWLAIGSDTSKNLIATAYWAYDASLMQRIALALGRKADAKSYQVLFDNISAAFHSKYVKPDGTVGTGSQTSYVLALHMHLLSEKERTVASDKLVADIQAHDWHLTTGFLGTPYLLLELSASGHSDAAYRLLLQNTFPSWRYMIEHGATTMWERWNSDQMLGDPGMNSFNHYAYGAVAEWLYTYVAGIEGDPDDPGFHRVRMHPQFDSRLGHAEATYDSPYGAIRSAWSVTGSTTRWNVALPPNTTALLYFPSAGKVKLFEGEQAIQNNTWLHFLRNENGSSIYEASAGSYSFSIRR